MKGTAFQLKSVRTSTWLVYLTWTTLSFSGWHTLELIEETILSKACPEGHQSEVIHLLVETNSVDFDISLYDVNNVQSED